MYTYERPCVRIGQTHLAQLGFVTLSPEVRGEAYIRWVQRALNNSGLCLTVDGKDTQVYREAVKRFRDSVGLTPGDKVDVTTQDALIKANERNLGYVLWLQMALAHLHDAGDLAIPPLPQLERDRAKLGPGTRKAIRAFQQRLVEGVIHPTGLPVKIKLKVDGVVGPKTETALAEFAASEPPGECI